MTVYVFDVNDADDANWRKITVKGGMTYVWSRKSTYVQNPPYFASMSHAPSPVTDIEGASILGLFLEIRLAFWVTLGIPVSFLGGIAILVGFLTRIAAAGNILVQLGAIMLVHLPNGLMGQGGYELNLLILTMCVVLAVAGAGRFSLDDRVARRA